MSLLEKYEALSKKKTLLERVEEKLNSNVGIYPPNTSKPELNENAFLLFIATHRQHQLQAIKSTIDTNRKQVIIPTGTGKTRIQIHIHVQDMIEKTRNNETGVYAIGAHRLLLCTQLMDELQDLCFECHLPVNVLYIGSARHDDKHVYNKYFDKGIYSDTFSSTYTTRTDEVLKFYEKTKEAKRHLIIVSTYHSFHKMSCIDSINITTYDEAHTTTAEDFTDNIQEVMPNTKRNYFFTATRKIYGEDKGMNDESFYGDTYGVSPKEMIKAGEITMPRIHIMMLEDGTKGSIKDNDETMLVKTVIEGFSEHKKKLKEESAHPNDIGAKLLVSCKGSNELDIIQSSDTFKKWCEDNNIKVFSFSSRYGSFEDFQLEVDRTQIYEEMKSLKDTDDCILLHIDILTEGINLPSITAVMLLRHLNTVKLLQTLGRALRLLKSDRIKLYSGQMKPDERDKYTKPYAYLMLPMHFESLDASSDDMKRMLKKLMSTYDLPTEEFLPPEPRGDWKEKEPLERVTPEDGRKLKKEYPLLHVIEDLIAESFITSLPKDPKEAYEILKKHLKEN